MKKKITLLIAASLLTMASVASAANKAETLTFTPVIGAYLFDGRQHLEANEMYGARVGYNFTKALSIEALFDYSHNNESTHPAIKPGISMYRYGGDVLYHFTPDSMFVPYVAAGFAGVNFDGNSDGTSDKGYKQTKGAFDYGVGAKLFVSDNVAIRGDVRHIIYKYDRTYNNYESTVGVYFAFGAPAPVAKAIEPEPAPIIINVEAAPAPAPVAAPVLKCPNTPAGVPVDKDGCPLDSDNDGVADYLDKCPNTPAGVSVGADGCPLDTDGDGVPDYLDKCPNTAPGVKVGTDGCALIIVSVEKKAAAAKRYCSKPAVLAINFDFDKTDIKPRYHDELKTLGDFLTYFPNSNGEIAGHADSVGTKAYNVKLSQRRADSVKQYVVDKFGIDASRITTKSYGESKPISSNKTKAGRAKNRRIVANFTCE